MDYKMIYVALFFVSLATSLGYRLPFIIGGRPAEEGSWPWQGSMRRYGTHYCGCSLIANTWALTAAHCVGQETEAYSFQFGSTDRREGGTVAKASKFIKHPDYDKGPGSHPNDIALIQFTTEVKGEHIGVVRLAANGTDYAGNDNCWITGWGHTIPGPEGILLPYKLQEVKIPVLTNEDCAKDWNEKITPDNICVGDRKKKSSCNGDSGGPLVCEVEGVYELAGVTSWGIIFCWPIRPSVYTRVSSYRDWIKDVSGI